MSGYYYEDKWPRLVVCGESVTPAQAEQIIVRTNGPYLHCNDRQWERDARRIMGLFSAIDEMDTSRRDETGYLRHLFEKEHESFDAIGMLRLQYLTNQRIASAYIGGGTHGWCNWDGTIQSADYNIGKWPTVGEVTDDWKQIARAFPFLNLKSQVVSMIYGGDVEMPLEMGRVWGTWTVQDGEVEFDEDDTTFMWPLGVPEDVKTEVTDDDIIKLITSGFGTHITLATLDSVMKRVRESLPKPERLAIDG
jgi:hypothetical protein